MCFELLHPVMRNASWWKQDLIIPFLFPLNLCLLTNFYLFEIILLKLFSIFVMSEEYNLSVTEKDQEINQIILFDFLFSKAY